MGRLDLAVQNRDVTAPARRLSAARRTPICAGAYGSTLNDDDAPRSRVQRPAVSPRRLYQSWGWKVSPTTSPTWQNAGEAHERATTGLSRQRLLRSRHPLRHRLRFNHLNVDATHGDVTMRNCETGHMMYIRAVPRRDGGDLRRLGLTAAVNASRDVKRCLVDAAAGSVTHISITSR